MDKTACSIGAAKHCAPPILTVGAVTYPLPLLVKVIDTIVPVASEEKLPVAVTPPCGAGLNVRTPEGMHPIPLERTFVIPPDNATPLKLLVIVRPLAV